MSEETIISSSQEQGRWTPMETTHCRLHGSIPQRCNLKEAFGIRPNTFGMKPQKNAAPPAAFIKPGIKPTLRL